MLWNSERTGLLYTDLICHSAKRQCNDRCVGGELRVYSIHTETQNVSVRYAETENVPSMLLYDKPGPEQTKQGQWM